MHLFSTHKFSSAASTTYHFRPNPLSPPPRFGGVSQVEHHQDHPIIMKPDLGHPYPFSALQICRTVIRCASHMKSRGVATPMFWYSFGVAEFHGQKKTQSAYRTRLQDRQPKLHISVHGLLAFPVGSSDDGHLQTPARIVLEAPETSDGDWKHLPNTGPTLPSCCPASPAFQDSSPTHAVWPRRLRTNSV